MERERVSDKPVDRRSPILTVADTLANLRWLTPRGIPGRELRAHPGRRAATESAWAIPAATEANDPTTADFPTQGVGNDLARPTRWESDTRTASPHNLSQV